MPEAAWFAASRPLGCVSDRTALVCVRLRLGIELVPVGGHEWSGGSAWRSQGLKGYGKGELQCPVCLCSCCCSCLLLLALTQNVRPPHHHNHPHGDHMAISTTTGTFVCCHQDHQDNERGQPGRGIVGWWGVGDATDSTSRRSTKVGGAVGMLRAGLGGSGQVPGIINQLIHQDTPSRPPVTP